MKLRTLGISLVLLWTFAAINLGCETHHRHGVGIEVDIHSKDYRDHHKDKGDHGDNDHHDKDDHHDDEH